jgi:large subunit ribosomal protein L31
MKTGLHPKYNVIAHTKCSSCGTTYEFGSTLESISVAICANCHPFYTGKQEIVIDKANKIGSFKEKQKKADEIKARLAEIEAKRKEREAKKVGVIGHNKLTLKDLLAKKK